MPRLDGYLTSPPDGSVSVRRHASPQERRQMQHRKKMLVLMWLATGVLAALASAFQPGDPTQRGIRSLTVFFLGPIGLGLLLAGHKFDR